MPSIFNPEKALRDLPKTPVILKAILSNVDAQRATTATDGANGWSVLEVVCHLNDMEDIYLTRAQQIVETNVPMFPPVDHEALVTENEYAQQDFATIVAVYAARRDDFVNYLRGLSPEQWQRTGVHPTWGEITLLQHVINMTLHDVNHIEQVVKALNN